MIFLFEYNNEETAPALRFPQLNGRAYTFNFSIDNQNYAVRVNYNVWTNNAMVSIFDSSQNPISINMPLIPKYEDDYSNFLYKKVFAGYFLYWDPNQDGFVFGAE